MGRTVEREMNAYLCDLLADGLDTLQCLLADVCHLVRELGVLVAVVQLTHAHVAGAVHLGVVGRTVVDPDVLHLHGAEVELASAPGVFITAACAAMVER